MKRLPRKGLPPSNGVALTRLACTGKQLLCIDKPEFIKRKDNLP